MVLEFDGSAPNKDIFQFKLDHQNGKKDILIISTFDPQDEGLYNLKYVMKAEIDFPDAKKEVYFDIFLAASSCTKRWRYPSGTPNFNSTFILAIEPL